MTCRFTHVYPDGPAPYITVIAPARRGDEVAQWHEMKQAAGDAIIAGGGTITLLAGDDITHTSGAILSTGGTVIMTADTEGNGGGGISQAGGSLTTGSLVQRATDARCTWAPKARFSQVASKRVIGIAHVSTQETWHGAP